MERKLTMPVLAIGAEKAFGANVAVVMRNAATNVQEVVVPKAGHWLMEEAPAQRSPRCGLPRSALSRRDAGTFVADVNGPARRPGPCWTFWRWTIARPPPARKRRDRETRIRLMASKPA